MVPAAFPAALRAALLLPALAVAASCADRPGDVVLITVDTLRADHLGLYGYERPTSPEIDAFFADGAIFERAYSATTYTSASTATLLSGLPPQEHRVRQHDQLLPDTTPLLTRFLPEAYQTAAFVGNMVLSDAGMGMADRFDHYDDEIAMRRDAVVRAERPAEEMTDAVLAWLAGERDPGRPLFLWVHYMDPHGPYRAPDPRARTFAHDPAPPPPPLPAPPWAGDAGYTSDDPRFYVDRYDEEVAHADRQIGRLLAHLDRAAPGALVVFTADHGETLLERAPPFSHALDPFEEVVRVPLLMRGPGVVPGRYRHPVAAIDVAPTLLRFAGVEPPPGLAGQDLRRPEALPADRTIFVESPFLVRLQTRAAIRGDEKFVYRVFAPKGRARIGARQRVDLVSDPLEKDPEPIAGLPPPAATLERRVRRDPDPAGRPESPERGTLQSGRVDLLRMLGYVDEGEGETDAPDPVLE